MTLMLYGRPNAALIWLLGIATSMSAATVAGRATNRTTNTAAAGDSVTLMRLAQGMQESSHTTTDSQGRYHLDLPDQGMYLIRVNHDKVNYFQPVPPGASEVDIDVFGAVNRVAGISIEADVLRMETDVKGETLQVVERFFIKNDSRPQKTQFSDRAFEFVLPTSAIIDGSAALSPEGMPVQASPAPTGEGNHYAFAFPLRPGETQFQVAYHLPYKTNLRLSPKIILNTDSFIVLLPESISFRPGSSTSYTAITAADIKGQAYISRGVRPSQPTSFAIQGTGQLPRDEQNESASRSDSAMGESSNSGSQPRGVSTSADHGGDDEPSAKYKWWIFGGLVLLFATTAGVVSKRQPSATIPMPIMASRVDLSIGSTVDSLTSLKNEIFALEEDKLRGNISESEYHELKGAFDVLLRRVLRRGNSS